MITLYQELYIGSGRDKSCYFHPEDKKKCVKILKNEGSARKRMLREIKVLNDIKSKGLNCPYVSSYMGNVETNLGLGYVFEYIESSDQTIEALDPNILKEKIFEIYNKLHRDALAMCEIRLHNFVLTKDNDFRIFDGLGWAEFFPICYWSKFFARKKIERKFTLLINDLEKRTKGWTQPYTSDESS